jgi:cyclophilin family peptidyl-prolyl cis-trans isomerase
MGGPGYTIDDEFGDAKTGLKFDVPGRLAMANTGRPKSAGSQFFITTDPAAYLNGSYTIFGQVLSGQSVVHDISIAARNQQDKPYRDIKIESITIEIAK